MNFCGTQYSDAKHGLRQCAVKRPDDCSAFSTSDTLSHSETDERKAKPVEMEREHGIDRSLFVDNSPANSSSSNVRSASTNLFSTLRVNLIYELMTLMGKDTRRGTMQRTVNFSWTSSSFFLFVFFSFIFRRTEWTCRKTVWLSKLRHNEERTKWDGDTLLT